MERVLGNQLQID